MKLYLHDIANFLFDEGRVVESPDRTSASIMVTEEDLDILCGNIMRLSRSGVWISITSITSGNRQVITGSRPLILDWLRVRKIVRTSNVLDFMIYKTKSKYGLSARVYVARKNKRGCYAIKGEDALLREFSNVKQAEMEISEQLLFEDNKPVDAVVTWVDQSCPDWQEQWQSVYPDHKANSLRYASNDELRYCLRSIYYNLPWVNNIYVVSNCNPPSWLRRPHLVSWTDHPLIFPSRSYLPTFNSNSIETCLHHIPGLSENFIYLNDDFFVTRILPKSFFFHASGRAIAHLERDPDVVGPIESSNADPYWAANLAGRDLLSHRLGYRPIHRHQHVPYALQKPVLIDIERDFAAEVHRTRMNKVRKGNDLSLTSLVYHHYGISLGTVLPGSARTVNIREGNFRRYKDIKDLLLLDSICVNDMGSSPNGGPYQKFASNLLLKLFPFPAPWE